VSLGLDVLLAAAIVPASTMTARGFGLPAAVVAVLVVAVDAYPGELSCERSITSGTIMGAAVNRLDSTVQVQLAKDGNTIACGGTLMAGDEGLTLVKASSGVGSQYIIEAIASAGTDGTGAWGIIDGDCSDQRLDNKVDNTYTVPPSGTVTLRIAHADGYGAVSTSADCTYTVQALPPTSPICADPTQFDGTLQREYRCYKIGVPPADCPAGCTSYPSYEDPESYSCNCQYHPEPSERPEDFASCDALLPGVFGGICA